MRKLYNNHNGKIHPSPPPSSAANHLSLLPLAIATLAAALAPEDKEVLAYLLSCSGTTATDNPANTIKKDKKNFSGAGDHPPQFNCNCFRCYTSYWARWDASPNRQLIHEIIDAYEDGLVHRKNGKNKKDKRKNKVSSPHAQQPAVEKASHAPPEAEEQWTGGDDQDELTMGSSSSSGKGSVTKILSFIGDRIWGVWGI